MSPAEPQVLDKGELTGYPSEVETDPLLATKLAVSGKELKIQPHLQSQMQPLDDE